VPPIHCGSSEPDAMPRNDTARPISCGGTRLSSPISNSTISQLPMPPKIAASAPCVVARFQKMPTTSGTKAPASVTL
jgi:hypothetical protein